MNRRTFDTLVSSVGLVLAGMLVLGGALLTWAHSFIGDQVHTQLAAQQIYFPAKGSESIAGPQFKEMQQYAGQQLTTGAQAKTYADHFIAVHLSEIGGGKTYAQLSSEAMANPDNADLQATVATMFKGETLRGLLLNAYAFDTMGTLAGIGAIVCFTSAGFLVVFGGLGMRHARRVPEDQRLLVGGHHAVPVAS